MNIAILSPNKNSYSETFIHAQKKGLRGNIFYYFGGDLPTHLEGCGYLRSRLMTLGNKFRKTFNMTLFNAHEEALFFSLKKNNIDVVLAQYGPTGEAVISVCKKLDIPLVVHFHGYDASVFEVIKKHDFYKRIFKEASKIIAVSKIMERKLMELGCPEDKLVYNTYGPNPNFFDLKPKYNSKQFLSVGRLTDKKAPYYTILAFSEVLKSNPDAKLKIGGNGALFNMCKNLVKYLCIEANVEFLGVISHEKIESLFKESIAFVQHSIIADNGDMEGTPVAILEASAAGLPIISTFHAGIPDVVMHEKTGLLCEEHDIKTMADNMNKILNTIDLARTLGQNGKTFIRDNFTLEKHLNILQDILVEVTQKD